LEDGKTAILDAENGLVPLTHQGAALRNIRRNSHESLASAINVIKKWEKENGTAIPKTAPPVETTIPEGKRGAKLISLAGSMRKRNFSQAAIEAALITENSAKCVPPFTETEVLDVARRYAGQYPTAAQPLILDPGAPLDCARAYLDGCHTRDGAPILLHHRGEFFTWTGTDYRPATEGELRCDLWGFLDSAMRLQKVKEGTEVLVPFKPTKYRVSNVFDGLRAAANVPETVDPPAFLDNPTRDAKNCLVLRNGVLDGLTEELIPHSPRFFNVGTADYDFNPKAKAPVWKVFLDSIFGNDRESRDILEEILGLSLIPETKFQKLFLLVGPRRSGKGTIGRLLPQLLGPRRVATPTIGSLGEQFGLQQLLGKSVAVIGDVRLRANAVEVAGRLLGISGEDGIDVARKFLPTWNGRLGVRFLLLSNELPHLNDPSGALSSRFIIIQLTESFLDREDHDLDAKLAAERPGILNQCLAGLRRLRARGRFIQPERGAPAIEALEALSTPHQAFLRDLFEEGPHYRVECETVFRLWGRWCSNKGREHAGNDAQLGKDLRTLIPKLWISRPRIKGKQVPFYVGLRLRR
jgi:putative DNA primase/helicase